MEIRAGRKTFQVKENFFDRAISFLDPVRGRERLKARAQMAVAGGYSGASKSRRQTKEWSPLGKSADSDILPDLPTLRSRTRDLARNAPLACGAINTATTSVIGPGLKVKPTIDGPFLGLSDEQAEDWERRAGRLFELWAGSQECDATRTQGFDQYQSMVFRSVLESGDIFILLPSIDRDGSPFRLKLQAIEADRVENQGFARDTETLAGGVQLDANGAPESYHIMKTHPGDGVAREWQIVRAFGVRTGRRNVLHVYDRKRPGQTRGVPYLAPVIESLKQLDQYTESELLAAVVSGMFTVFVKSDDGDAELDLDALSGETGSSSTDDDLKLGAGAVAYLGPRESIETADPKRPNVAFDPFVQAVLRHVGVALEIPFELLIKHFTASYSASRMALQEAWRFFKTRRSWLVSVFCQPVYEAFLTEQIARGRIEAPGFFTDPLVRAAYLGAEWRGRPAGHIQPLQEAKAADQRIQTGISTIEKEAAEYDGADFDKLHTQRAREVKRRKDDGVVEQVVTAPDTPEEQNEDT